MAEPNHRRGRDGPEAAGSIDWASALAQHEGWLRRIVGARVGEPQAVEEVMQEVALAAVAQRAPLLDPGKVAPWLYRLAVRQTLLYRRKQGRQRKLIQRYAQYRLNGHDTGQTDPLDWLLSEERKGQVREAVGRLPRRDAEILMLKYGEDWSYRELAEHLGISHSAVEARLHRARKRLRAELTVGRAVEVPT